MHLARDVILQGAVIYNPSSIFIALHCARAAALRRIDTGASERNYAIRRQGRPTAIHLFDSANLNQSEKVQH